MQQQRQNRGNRSLLARLSRLEPWAQGLWRTLKTQPLRALHVALRSLETVKELILQRIQELEAIERHANIIAMNVEARNARPRVSYDEV